MEASDQQVGSSYFDDKDDEHDFGNESLRNSHYLLRWSESTLARDEVMKGLCVCV